MNASSLFCEHVGNRIEHLVILEIIFLLTGIFFLPLIYIYIYIYIYINIYDAGDFPRMRKIMCL